MKFHSTFRKIFAVSFFAAMPVMALAQPVPRGQQSAQNQQAIVANDQQPSSLASEIQQMRYWAQAYGDKFLSITIHMDAAPSGSATGGSATGQFAPLAQGVGSCTVTATEQIGRQKVTISKTASTCLEAGREVEREFQRLEKEASSH